MSSESNFPIFEVAVWGYGSLFTHTTVSPAFTVRSAGEKAVPSMVTVWVAGLTPPAAAPGAVNITAAPSAARRDARARFENVLLTAVTSRASTGSFSRDRGARRTPAAP